MTRKRKQHGFHPTPWSVRRSSAEARKQVISALLFLGACVDLVRVLTFVQAPKDFSCTLSLPAGTREPLGATHVFQVKRPPVGLESHQARTSWLASSSS